MKTNFGMQLVFLGICAFFASWPFWFPSVYDKNVTMSWVVSLIACGMGICGVYYIILMIVFQVKPFDLEQQGLRIEKVRLLPPGKEILFFQYDWMESSPIIKKVETR